MFYTCVCLIDLMCLVSCCGSLWVCVFFCIPSVSASLDGPLGIVLTEDTDTREPAIRQRQPAHYPWAHDNSCLVPTQGQGCNCSYYVMKWRRGGEQWREGVYWDVSQCIIPHRANRLPVTRFGWGLLLTDFSILVWFGVWGMLVAFYCTNCLTVVF